MAGLVLFDYFVYFVVLVWRFLREGPTNNWAVVTADVSADPAVTSGVCPKVEFIYTYSFEGKRRPGSYDVLFVSGEAARECAIFREGSHVRVRVKPGNPDESVIRRVDLSPY